MKAGLWKTDWFLGAVVVLVVLVFNRSSDLIPSLEQKAYDPRRAIDFAPPVRQGGGDRHRRHEHREHRALALVARDPRPDDDLLAGAKNQGHREHRVLQRAADRSGIRLITKLLELATPTPEMAPIVTLLKEAEQTLNTDRRLAESYVKAGNVLLPVFFNIDIPRGPARQAAAGILPEERHPRKIGDDFGALATSEAQMPIELIGRSAAALGHLSARPDVDGGVRSEPLVLRYFDHHFPSLSLMIGRESLNLEAGDIKIQPDSVRPRAGCASAPIPSSRCTPISIATATTGRVPVDSFYDVYSGKIRPPSTPTRSCSSAPPPPASAPTR